MSFAHGLDYSQHQGVVDWKQAAAGGAEFAYIRAAYGLATDTQFSANWYNSHYFGVLRGAYHFVLYNVDPIAQAKVMASLIFNDMGDLDPAADAELEANIKAPPDSADRLWAYLNQLEAGVGRTPAIYTSAYYWSLIGNRDPKWRKFRLWVADPNHKDKPLVPEPWGPDEWEFWQYGTLADASWFGVRTNSNLIDHNWFHGDHYHLVARYAPHLLPQPEPPPAAEPPAPLPEPTLEERIARLEEQAKSHGWSL